MRAGGTVSGELWLARVRNLRPGDYIRVANWTGELWMGGEPLIVQAEPSAAPKGGYYGATGGYYDVRVQVPHDISEWRVLCMKGDDQVQLTARDAIREMPVTAPAKPRKQKPKKGQQLKLFDDD